MSRIKVLDGWRAVSIILVLCGHLLPLTSFVPNSNAAVAAMGMVLFFTLSGFLITETLLVRPQAVPFLVRRLFRIVPLAWVAMTVLVIATGASIGTAIGSYLFVGNLPPYPLLDGGGQLWSLGVEVQFYLAVGLIVAVAGRRGLFVLPVLVVTVTGLRIAYHAEISIETQFRVDEILAGATLALVWSNYQDRLQSVRLPRWWPWVALPLLIASCDPAFGPLNYVRPYLSAATVGVSLFSAPPLMRRVLESAPARYVALISYAVYVVHGMLLATWFGSGSVLVKYAKRPLLLVAVWGVAHLSTFYFERPMTNLGRRIARRLSPLPGPAERIKPGGLASSSSRASASTPD